MGAAIVFVHGINAHLEVTEQDKAWRSALRQSGLNIQNVPSTFAYYSDWFFAQPNVAESALELELLGGGTKLTKRQKILIEEADQIATQIIANTSPDELAILRQVAAEHMNGPEKEGLPNFDLTTLLPPVLIKGLIRKLVFQLYDYFEDIHLTHPTRDVKPARAQSLIRGLFRKAVADARKLVGESGEVIVLAHSMGSVVAWDCLQHDPKCGDVDGLVTFGSPLGLDFVQRELKKSAGSKYDRSFPKRLQGDWHNIVARFDKIATLDTSFDDIFANRSPFKIFATRISNPDFRWSVRPSTRLTTAHSGSGYLKSPSMAVALQSFGLPRQEAFVEPVSGHLSANAERLAARRFRTHQQDRQRKKARLDAQKSMLGVEVDERVVNQLNQIGIEYATATKMVADAHSNPAGRVMLERVLGSPDFIQSSYALKMAALTHSVGQILIGQISNGQPIGYGSGFLISPRLLMTNSHVLESATIARDSTVRFDYAKDINDKDMPGTEIGLRPDLFFISSPEEELDYTIVAIDEPVGGLGRPWSRLIESSGKVLMGQSVNIIQHPRGRRQELITRNSTLSFIDDKPDYAHYSGDTEPGSSGSPCYNDRWELAFLHHASVPETDTQGQYIKKNGQRWSAGDDPNDINWVANEGIRISRIVEDVKRQGLTPQHAKLFEECFQDPQLDRYLRLGLYAPGSSDFSDERSENGQWLRRHDDGRVSYLFEVSFGPHGSSFGGQSAFSSSPAETPTASAASPFVHRPPIKTAAAPLDNQLESSIADLVAKASDAESYYDRDKDAIDAKKYYADIEHETGEVRMFHEHQRLVARTHDKIFGYNTARLRVLYPYVDLHPDGTLRSVYSGDLMRATDVILEEAMILADRLPQSRENIASLGLEGILALSDAMEAETFTRESSDVPFNCEHVVPQSWYDKRKPMVSDLHHLFTCERGCNSYRGNRPYGDLSNYNPGQTPIDLIEAELRASCGLMELDASGGLVFEPENNKGVVARATLYFLLRYQNEVGNKQGEMPLETVETLLDWHSQNEVTDYERHRNRAIFLTQGNRNPFIDFDDLAEKLAFKESFE